MAFSCTFPMAASAHKAREMRRTPKGHTEAQQKVQLCANMRFTLDKTSGVSCGWRKYLLRWSWGPLCCRPGWTRWVPDSYREQQTRRPDCSVYLEHKHLLTAECPRDPEAWTPNLLNSHIFQMQDSMCPNQHDHTMDAWRPTGQVFHAFRGTFMVPFFTPASRFCFII